jgi:hypothetical protein
MVCKCVMGCRQAPEAARASTGTRKSLKSQKSRGSWFGRRNTHATEPEPIEEAKTAESGLVEVVQQDDAPQLPCVYFEIGIDGHAAGRLVFQVCVCVIEFPGDGWCSLAGFAWVYGNECVALAAALCVAWNRAGLWFGPA